MHIPFAGLAADHKDCVLLAVLQGIPSWRDVVWRSYCSLRVVQLVRKLRPEHAAVSGPSELAQNGEAS